MSLGTSSIPVAKANERHDLYRWKIGGEGWACAAYDHGPFCRRCQKVEDELSRTLLDLVEEGAAEMWDTERDGWKFKLTSQGTAEAEMLIATNPEARQFYESIDLDAIR